MDHLEHLGTKDVPKFNELLASIRQAQIQARKVHRSLREEGHIAPVPD